jgi:hypothetical protein
MMLSALTRRSTAFASRRPLSTYIPTMVEKRQGEEGVGGRSSNAGLKVAVFGGSGFLGHYVCGELGMYCIISYRFLFCHSFAHFKVIFVVVDVDLKVPTVSWHTLQTVGMTWRCVTSR